jgi:hypothetical protein
MAAKNFLVQKLFRYGRAFDTVATASYESVSGPDRLNELFRWLMLVDNADWVAPAIAYFHKYEHDQETLERYFTDLERLAASFLVRRINVNQRIERYATLLGSVENGEDLYTSSSPLQLGAAEKTEVLAALNGDIYHANVRARAYILLRLDRELSADPAYFNRKLSPTIEHVLPQNPEPGSNWLKLFTEAQREELTNKLGNLALLTRSKNSAASNYEFEKKRDTYFTGKKGIVNYALTVSILAHKGDWTPNVVEDRQKAFLAAFTKLWRLEGR